MKKTFRLVGHIVRYRFGRRVYTGRVIDASGTLLTVFDASLLPRVLHISAIIEVLEDD